MRILLSRRLGLWQEKGDAPLIYIEALTSTTSPPATKIPPSPTSPRPTKWQNPTRHSLCMHTAVVTQ